MSEVDPHERSGSFILTAALIHYILPEYISLGFTLGRTRLRP